MIDFDFIKGKNILLCRFHGRLGAENAIELDIELQKKFNEIKSNNDLEIQFDLKDVSYIASSFIRICVTLAKQLKKGNFSITNTNPLIKKTYKIAGLDEILNVS